MAAGDITITAKGESGGRNFVSGTIEVPSAAWPAGGYAFTPTLLGLTAIELAVFEPLEITATTFVIPTYVRSIGKVTVTEGLSANAHIESNEDTSSATGVSIFFTAYGR